LKDIKNVVVMEKDISLGFGGMLANELKTVFYKKPQQPIISGFVVGLGGRDVPQQSIRKTIEKGISDEIDIGWVDLREDIIGGKFL
jgi:pyruvate ferredoxin oxidoreductase alpha subunit